MVKHHPHLHSKSSSHPSFLSKALGKFTGHRGTASREDDEIPEDDRRKRDFGSKAAIDAEISRRGVRARGLYELEAEMGALD